MTPQARWPWRDGTELVISTSGSVLNWPLRSLHGGTGLLEAQSGSVTLAKLLNPSERHFLLGRWGDSCQVQQVSCEEGLS